MLISTTTGHETFQNGAAKCHLFVVPIPANSGKEVHVGVAAKMGKQVRLSGAPSRVSAARSYREDVGTWTTANYDVPENTVLKLFAMRSGGFGAMRVSGQLLLRVRTGAAYRRIGAILTGHQAATFSRAWTEGRFDILSVEEARRLGAVIPPHYVHSFAEEMTRRAFEQVEVEPASTAAPTVQVALITNSSGEQVEVVSTQRRRALDL